MDDPEISISEKLKFLFYMKVVHLKLNKGLGKLKSHLIPFELFIICESIDDEVKKSAYVFPHKDATLRNNQDTILRSLIFIFENLETKGQLKNLVIKANICELFAEFKYPSAKHFVQQLVQNSEENLFLRKRAQFCVAALNNAAIKTVYRNSVPSKDSWFALGSPKIDSSAQPLAKLAKASFLSPTGTCTINETFIRHKRPLSYNGKCENVDEEEESFKPKQSMQLVLEKKALSELPKYEDTLDDSQELSAKVIKTESFARPLGAFFTQTGTSKKILKG